MTVFNQPFMFFDNPRGGTDQMDKARAAGFAGGFGNVIDYPAEAWDAHRASAKTNGMWFGPWGRTGHPPPQGTGFEKGKAERIRLAAFDWGGTPYVLNCEKEIDNSGDTITKWIATWAGTDDCALSCEAWPFGNVDWGPVSHLPVLPQIMPPDWGWAGKSKAEIMARANSSKDAWHLKGIRCVWFTFGAFGGMTPGQYELQAPFSLYTADAIGIQNYGLWSPTSSGFVGCVEPPKPPDPPTPVGPNTATTRKKMTDWALAWERGQGGPKDLTAITIGKRIVRPTDQGGFTKEQWARMAPTIKAVLDQEQDEG